MGTELFKIYIILGIILVVVMGAGFYYVFNESVPDLPASSPVPTSNWWDGAAIEPGSNGSSILPRGLLSDIEDLARAKIHITTGGKEKIIVSWENLPDGTDRIVIFRSDIRISGAWVRWKTVSIASSRVGSTEVTLKKREDSTAYEYYAQAFSPNGYTLWASQITQAEPPPPAPTESLTSPTATTTGGIAQGQTPSSGSQGGSQNQTSSATVSPGAAPSTSSSSGSQSGNSGTSSTVSNVSNPPPAAPLSPSQQVAYYTPSGQIAGYYSPQLDPFWVSHVNQNIEIGWQNLPPPTNAIVVYRSQNQSGPWKELMRQEQPSTSTRDFVRLVDFTISSSYYYRMDALSGTNILAAYEPIFLSGIMQ